MPKTQKLIDQLMLLGLTQYEAQAYIALVVLQRATAAKIAEESKIPRPKVYEALDSLERKGFILSIAGTPVTYIAKSPKEVIANLKRYYMNAFEALEKDLTFLAKKEQFEEQNLFFIKSREVLINEFRKQIEQASEIIEIFDCFSILLERPEIIDILKQAVSRDINVTIYTSQRNSQLFSSIFKNVFYIPSEFLDIKDIYVFIDRHSVLVALFDTQFSSYSGFFGNLKALVNPVKLLFNVLKKNSQQAQKIITKADPLSYIKIISPEKLLFMSEIIDLEPRTLLPEAPYTRYFLVTNERLIFISIYGSSHQIFALPKFAVTEIRVVSFRNRDYLEIQYHKAGIPSTLHVALRESIKEFLKIWS